MKQNIFYASAIFLGSFVFFSCKKNADTNSNITVESLSGTYALKALTWTYGGTTHNVYDSIEVCERDNLIKLNTDKTVNFIDAGTVCAPPADDNDTWSLSGDSLYLGATAAIIKSFDGTTLVITGNADGNSGVIGTTTLQKR
jgi:hypothetical protein